MQPSTLVSTYEAPAEVRRMVSTVDSGISRVAEILVRIEGALDRYRMLQSCCHQNSTVVLIRINAKSLTKSSPAEVSGIRQKNLQSILFWFRLTSKIVTMLGGDGKAPMCGAYIAPEPATEEHQVGHAGITIAMRIYICVAQGRETGREDACFDAIFMSKSGLCLH
jgi:hypothetical protein